MFDHRTPNSFVNNLRKISESWNLFIQTFINGIVTIITIITYIMEENE